MSPRTSKRLHNRPWKAQARARKREQAQVRADERAARGDAGQLAHLDALLGPGMGAQRERARLQRAIGRAA